MTGLPDKKQEFPCLTRRVTLKTSSKFPSRLSSFLRLGMREMLLPESPNVLSAGRNPHTQSAIKLIPSGVNWRCFFRHMSFSKEPDPGRKVTRHPFVFTPRRTRKVFSFIAVPLLSCFLPGTGRSRPLSGNDHPDRLFDFACSGEVS